MEFLAGYISLPIIVAIVYMMIEAYKEVIPKDNQKYKRFIPLIALFLGIILGIVGYLLSPDVIPANNILVAIFLGGNSGLAATGANQVFKQTKQNHK